MPFSRFVETGRVAYISSGRFRGRLATIVDVIDQTRALVDGPVTHVPRTAVRLNQLRLTKFRVKFPYKASTSVVRKVWKDGKIMEKWKDSQWAKNSADKRKRRNLSDLDRFKLRFARRQRNQIRTVEYNKRLKEDRKIRAKTKLENKGKKGWGRKPRKAGSPAKKVASPAKKVATPVKKGAAPAKKK